MGTGRSLSAAIVVACIGIGGIAFGCGGSSENDGASGGAGGTPSGGSSSGGTSSGGSSTGGTSSGGTSSGGAAGVGAGGSATGGSGGKLTAKECFKDIGGDGTLGPNYDQYGPTIGSHCYGTNQQDIQGVEKVVFLGDSVTAGTPPTPANQFYRSLVGEEMKKKFPGVEIADCSAWGARTDDLLVGQQQIPKCFPSGGDPKKTLVVFTIGGNDIAAWAKDLMPVAQAMTEADKAADLLEDAVKWLIDPAKFPKGIYVIYANPYEYTDATGDLYSCPAAVLGGLKGNWIEGAPAVVHLQERFLKIAVDHKADMIFTLETFCGHGYHRDDQQGICYRGPGAELWFDITCIHPNPTGHAKIAEMFEAVVAE